MKEKTEFQQLDQLDQKILKKLQVDGRISNAELAASIDLSPPATLTRVKRLEQEGYISRYVAQLNREQLGYDILCFIQINLRIHGPEEVALFRSKVSELPEVLECHHVTGDFDYLLKVVVQNREELEHFIVQVLTPLPGIAHVHTSLAFAEIKSTSALPLK
ncbi:MAG: Lrp/AsnC family transcriptional regulator [Chloroflexi bacterium]|nr:MAG: Lrp/AsnC family transcriptional regulator [Chloroflexota bacterium]MBL1196886.1 Lrp/AsnC family transcriptional regulator [Chloroflexota bacterium]NOH14182.1 Lrp/AsnC family transcriptional regulator [Chloroflexota bacterium]